MSKISLTTLLRQCVPILALLTLPNCGSSSGHAEILPPNLELLEYRRSFALIPVAGQRYLEATVPGTREYKLPTGGNCSLPGTWHTHEFVMEPDDDFYDLVLSDREGVGSDPSDAKGFQYYQYTGGALSQTWNLLLRQGTPAQEYLRFVTWRFLVNASEIGIQNEVGDGGVAMPPLNGSPWQRKFEAKKIGGEYRLYSTNLTIPENITGSLTFKLTVKLPKFCEARAQY